MGFQDIVSVGVNPMVLPLGILLIVVAEEVLWRGYAGSVLKLSLWASTLLYAAGQSAALSFWIIAAALVLGVFWELLRRKTGGILAPTIAHALFTGVVVYLPL